MHFLNIWQNRALNQLLAIIYKMHNGNFKFISFIHICQQLAMYMIQSLIILLTLLIISGSYCCPFCFHNSKEIIKCLKY